MDPKNSLGWGQWGILGLQVGNLQHLQPAMRATNSRGGANMRHLGAVGWQPTAFTASNAGYKQQGWCQHEASWGCRLATYSIYSQQCGLQTTWVGPTRGILGLQVGNLQHLQPAMRATNSRGGANMRHLGAVGWQPTAFTASNAGYKQQGWCQHEASWGCRLATYSICSQQCGLQTAGVGPTWGILGLQVGNLQHLQPAMRATNNMGRANTRHLGAAGWQPTAFTASNAGYKQHGWGQHEASWGCRLATYSIYSQQCGLQTTWVVPTWGILGL